MTDRNWFSNFLPFDEPFDYMGISYPTVEHYYQAMKTMDKTSRIVISKCDSPGLDKVTLFGEMIEKDFELVGEGRQTRLWIKR